MLKFAVVIVFAILGCKILINNFGDNTGILGTQVDGANGIEAPKPAPIPVSAAQLFKDYSVNRMTADKMYKGKLLEVTGPVESINKDSRDNIYVVLHVGDFGSVQCCLSKNYKSQAAQLVKDQTITVVGEGADIVVDLPVLKECFVK